MPTSAFFADKCGHMRTLADHNADKCGQTRTKTLNQSRGIPLGTRVTSLRALSVSFSVLSQKQEMRSGTHLLRPDRVSSCTYPYGDSTCMYVAHAKM